MIQLYQAYTKKQLGRGATNYRFRLDKPTLWQEYDTRIIYEKTTI